MNAKFRALTLLILGRDVLGNHVNFGKYIWGDRVAIYNVDYDYQHALTRLKDGNPSRRVVIISLFNLPIIYGGSTIIHKKVVVA